MILGETNMTEEWDELYEDTISAAEEGFLLGYREERERAFNGRDAAEI